MRVNRFEYDSEGGLGFSLAKPIKTGSWQKSTGGLLAATDIASSFVLAVHNPTSQKGYLGHFRPAGTSLMPPRSTQMINTIKFENRGERLNAWIGGTTNPPPKSSEEEYEKYAQLIKAGARVIEQLGELSLSTLQRGWLETDEKIPALTFDTASGDVNYAVELLDYSE